MLSWLRSASTSAVTHNNSAWYGPLAATPPVLLTAHVTPQCGSPVADTVVYNSSLTAVQSIIVPSGCPLSVSVRLSDALNNTVVSSLADTVVQTTRSTGACAGGETNALLSRGTTAITVNMAGITGSTVTTSLSVRLQLTNAAGFASLSTGPVVFVVGNCSAGTGRTSSVSATAANACSLSGQLSCTPCTFGTYSFLSNNLPCNVLNSTNALSTRNLVCALPGYWVLADNSTGTAGVYACLPGLCAGACVAQNGTDTVNPSLFGLHCHSNAGNGTLVAHGQVAEYCSGAVGCSNGYGGFMCGACADGYALWHGECVGASMLI